MKYFLEGILILILFYMRAGAQDTVATKGVSLPSSYSRKIDKKIGQLNGQIDKQTGKYLKQLALREQKLLALIPGQNSLNTTAKYGQLLAGLKAANGKSGKIMTGHYIPSLDSLKGALGFLKDADNIISKSKDIRQKLGNSLDQVNQLQDKINQSDEIKRYVRQREEQLSSLIESCSGLPRGAGRYLREYKEQAYYYRQQLKEYENVIRDPGKLSRKVLSTLRTVPAFQQFMGKYSMLASLFPAPEGIGTPAVLGGLQTRASVQQVLQQVLPANAVGTDPAGYFRQQVGQAQAELTGIKDKVSNISGGGSDRDDLPMPDFKPNQQKTKTFLQRIELGTNLQTQKANYYFPVTTDVGITAGYRINDKSTAGIGISGKMGWGSSWKNIRFSGQGLGLRTFFEMKAPDLFGGKSRFMTGLWMSGGAEMNYFPLVSGYWQSSALVGLGKKYSIPSRAGKTLKGNIQVLLDLLHNQHTPPTPALVWRAGYNF